MQKAFPEEVLNTPRTEKKLRKPKIEEKFDEFAIEDLENKCLDLKTARLNCIKKEIELMENFDIYDR